MHIHTVSNGLMDGYLYIIDCLRQVVASLPRRLMRRRRNGAIMNGRREGSEVRAEGRVGGRGAGL
jgi:hypothetical protein